MRIALNFVEDLYVIRRLTPCFGVFRRLSPSFGVFWVFEQTAKNSANSVDRIGKNSYGLCVAIASTTLTKLR